jgi:hypothetical protein
MDTLKVKLISVFTTIKLLAKGWTIQGSNLAGARFLHAVQTGPGTHSASCTVGTGFFQGIKRSDRGAECLSHSVGLRMGRIYTCNSTSTLYLH